MDAEIKRKWVEALRSGKYEQCKGHLRQNDAFCCIGVLGAIQHINFESLRLDTSRLPKHYGAGLEISKQMQLASMNDEGTSFVKIADYIEEHL